MDIKVEIKRVLILYYHLNIAEMWINMLCLASPADRILESLNCTTGILGGTKNKKIQRNL